MKTAKLGRAYAKYRTSTSEKIQGLFKLTSNRYPDQSRGALPRLFIKGSSSGKEVWVLKPKALPGFLDHESDKMSNEDIHLFASRLAEHIRAWERATTIK